jgi:hypothetical protein
MAMRRPMFSPVNRANLMAPSRFAEADVQAADRRSFCDHRTVSELPVRWIFSDQAEHARLGVGHLHGLVRPQEVELRDRALRFLGLEQRVDGLHCRSSTTTPLHVRYQER